MFKKLLVIIILFGWCFSLNQANASTPMRIISLAPSITETLFLLGLEKQMVGVTANCDHPLEVKKIDKVGLFGDPHLEKIVMLKPTVVFTTDLGQHPVLARLKDLNIRVVDLPCKNIKDVLASIKIIGEAAGKQKEARELINGLEGRINSVKGKVASLARPKVFVALWVNPNGVITAGRTSFINELISLAGGKNIASRLNISYPIINPESIAAEDPEVIIYGSSTNNGRIKNDLLAQPEMRNVRGVKLNRMFGDINPDLFMRPGPRLVNGLEEIAQRLHPGINIKKRGKDNGKA